jgi:hypothetical protein
VLISKTDNGYGISDNGKLKIGEYYTVTIQKTEDFDLYASL